MNVQYRLSIRLSALLLCFLAVAGLSAVLPVRAADSPLTGGDGSYTLTADLDGMVMGSDAFDRTVKVEKIGERYYLYLTVVKAGSMTDLSLTLRGMQVGTQVTAAADDSQTYCFTLGAADLQGTLPFTVFVSAMKRSVSFSLRLNLAEATRTGSEVEERGERPAEFVPVMTTDAGDRYEVAVGTPFVLPVVTAVLGDEDCPVRVTVTAPGADGGQTDITDGRFTPQKAGEYTVTWTASSPLYKTNLGNDTYVARTATVRATVGGSSLARMEAADGILPDGTTLQATQLSVGSLYDTAAAAMKKVADSYAVYSVTPVNADGDAVLPTGKVTLYVQADSTLDRRRIAVYALDTDGNLTALPAEGYGRYVRFETDCGGTFIICNPGVAFVMPMWGWAAIAGAVLLLVLAAIALAVRAAVRRRRA